MLLHLRVHVNVCAHASSIRARQHLCHSLHAPPPLKCHVALSTHVWPSISENEPFVRDREEALSLRENEEEALVIGGKGDGGNLLLLFGTSGSTSLTSGELGCFQKCSTFHSSLLPSTLPLLQQWPTSSQTHHTDQCLSYPLTFSVLLFQFSATNVFPHSHCHII